MRAGEALLTEISRLCVYMMSCGVRHSSIYTVYFGYIMLHSEIHHTGTGHSDTCNTVLLNPAQPIKEKS